MRHPQAGGGVSGWRPTSDALIILIDTVQSLVAPMKIRDAGARRIRLLRALLLISY